MWTVRKEETTETNTNSGLDCQKQKINRRCSDEGNWVETTCEKKNIISLPIPSDATQELCAQHRSVCPHGRGMTKMWLASEMWDIGVSSALKRDGTTKKQHNKQLLYELMLSEGLIQFVKINSNWYNRKGKSLALILRSEVRRPERQHEMLLDVFYTSGGEMKDKP